MKYEVEVTVDLPRERMIALFDDPENLPKWQTGLKSFEFLSGDLGKPGAKSKLVYDMNGRKVEMIETITARDLPDLFSGTYEAPGVWSHTENRFYEAGPQKTRWITSNEFKFKGLMALMGIFMRASFPKQTLREMNHFKQFAESA